MPGDGVVFTEDAANRIARTVRHFEGGYFNRERDLRTAPRPVQQPITLYARVTSGSPDGNGLYPATLTQWQPDTLAWTDQATCKVLPINGETLTSGTRYAVRAAGTVGTDQVFSTIGTVSSGGGGGSTSLTWGTYGVRGSPVLQTCNAGTTGSYLLPSTAGTPNYGNHVASGGTAIFSNDGTDLLIQCSPSVLIQCFVEVSFAPVTTVPATAFMLSLEDTLPNDIMYGMLPLANGPSSNNPRMIIPAATPSFSSSNPMKLLWNNQTGVNVNIVAVQIVAHTFG